MEKAVRKEKAWALFFPTMSASITITCSTIHFPMEGKVSVKEWTWGNSGMRMTLIFLLEVKYNWCKKVLLCHEGASNFNQKENGKNHITAHGKHWSMPRASKETSSGKTLSQFHFFYYFKRCFSLGLIIITKNHSKFLPFFTQFFC